MKNSSKTETNVILKPKTQISQKQKTNKQKLKNNHPELSTTDIGKVFHMARTTIQKKMQKGTTLGICIYDKEFERKFRTKEARLKYYSNKNR